MSKMKQSIHQHPTLFSIPLLFLAILAAQLPQGLGQEAYYAVGSVVQIGISLLLLLVLRLLGLSESAYINLPRSWKSIWLALPFLLYCLFIGQDFFLGALTIHASRRMWSLYLLYYVSVGIFEEMICRSTILNLMLRKWGNTRSGIYGAVLLSSFLFGIAHLSNLAYGRLDVPAVIAQVCYALFNGVFFGACMIRIGSVIPCMVMHALFDICGMFRDISTASTFGLLQRTSIESAQTSIALFLPLFLFGLYFLRKAEGFQWGQVPKTPEKQRVGVNN